MNKLDLLILFILPGIVQAQQNTPQLLKNEVVQTISTHQSDLVAISDSIWNWAETALLEDKSAALLADYAEKKGFKVRRGIAGLPTAFVAEYGSGRPVIGILGEYDALPGLSQKAGPQKSALKEGAPGHGCGHNLFGAGSLGAALAIKDLLTANLIKGTIRFYGTPAEEDVGGKLYMARAGLFNDLDVCLDWHPDYENKANMQSSQAMVDYLVSFHGIGAHAAADPWNGRSALDAAELFTHGLNQHREHMKTSARMHYIYKQGGDVPNVVPAEASVWLWIRDSKRTGVNIIEQRMKEMAEGAAKMAGVTFDIKIQTGDYELLVNETGARALQKNMEWLGAIEYSPAEIKFADEIMRAAGKESKGLYGHVKPLEQTRENPDNGSTDVGDVSYITPEITALITTAPYLAPWHSWIVVACGGMSIGHKGMIYAAKSLATTMVDLFMDPLLRQNIRQEFERRKGSEVWVPMIPEGPPPLRKK